MGVLLVFLVLLLNLYYYSVLSFWITIRFVDMFNFMVIILHTYVKLVPTITGDPVVLVLNTHT